MSLIVGVWLVVSAWADEVVWLDADRTADDVARVALIAGATRAPLSADELRFAALDVGPTDLAAWTSLGEVLRDVRAYETRLDGELVIQRDLARPIAGLTIVPDDAARDRLYAALVYQGFAVDRFFADQLGVDPRAAELRVALPDGTFVPRPWFDAMALEPARVPTPYEIAEAPQRARYAVYRERVAALLPGLLAVDGGLPEGASLVLDGRSTPLTAGDQVRVTPGRHYVHVVREGHVLQRAVVEVEPAGSVNLLPGLPDTVWRGWISDLRDDGLVAVPEPLWPALRAVGGSVVVAWRDRDGLHATRLSPAGAERIELTRGGSVMRSAPEAPADGSTRARLEVGVAAGGGWLQSGDFYLQDPAVVPRTRASVNAGAVHGALDVSLGLGVFRLGVVGDVAVPIGEAHVARVGDDGSQRVRPDLSLAVGVKWVQVTGGFLFPYHPTVGARVTVPVWRGLELVGGGRAGLPISITRDDRSVWRGKPVVQLWAGLGWRFATGPTR